MPFSIDRLLATDIPACVQIYFDSFQNSHSLACWPRVHTIRAFWEAMFLDEMDDPKSHFIKAVPYNAAPHARTSRRISVYFLSVACLVMKLGVKELIKLCIYCWGHPLLYTCSGSVAVWMLLSGNLQHLGHVMTRL
jgi:hypothetical protein